MVDLLVIVILVVDFVISIWNSYAAGLGLGFLRNFGGPSWIRLTAVLALAMGLLGET